MAKKKSEDIDNNAEAQKTAPPANQSRVYNKQIEFDSDLYQLAETKMQIRVPLTQPPEYKPTSHMHWFRTFDSDGRKQIRSQAVGGHFHMMEVIPQQNGPAIVNCGPAVKEIQNKYKKKVLVPFIPEVKEPGAEDPGDSHTHEVVYNRSQRLNMRTANAEAAKVLTMDANKGAPIPGISG